MFMSRSCPLLALSMMIALTAISACGVSSAQAVAWSRSLASVHQATRLIQELDGSTPVTEGLISEGQNVVAFVVVRPGPLQKATVDRLPNYELHLWLLDNSNGLTKTERVLEIHKPVVNAVGLGHG